MPTQYAQQFQSLEVGQLKIDGLVTSPLALAGSTGATAASRYVGATVSGAPGSGTFAVGDFIIDQGGNIRVCTVAGTPGTWVAVGGAATSATAPFPVSGTSATALTVAQVSATNPTLQVDTSTASAATGLLVRGLAAGSGLVLTVISSGPNEALTLDAKGSGTITIGGSSTGNIQFGGGAATERVGTVGANTSALSVSATAFNTNPQLQVDTSAASVVTGLKITGAGSGAGVALAAISTAAAETITLDAKGAGPVLIGSVSTGNITLGQAGAVLVNFARTVVANGGGAAPTFGTIGGSGPATAGQNGWLAVQVAGTATWIPIWR